MDKSLACAMVRTAFRAGGVLTDDLPLLKAHLPPATYRERAIAIAAAVHAIHEALLVPALAAFPELDAEIEASIEKYGRFI